MTDVKAEAIVDILPNTIAEVKPETLSEKLADVKVGILDEMCYKAIWRPSQWSDYGKNASKEQRPRHLTTYTAKWKLRHCSMRWPTRLKKLRPRTFRDSG